MHLTQKQFDELGLGSKDPDVVISIGNAIELAKRAASFFEENSQILDLYREGGRTCIEVTQTAFEQSVRFMTTRPYVLLQPYSDGSCKAWFSRNDALIVTHYTLAEAEAVKEIFDVALPTKKGGSRA